MRTLESATIGMMSDDVRVRNEAQAVIARVKNGVREFLIIKRRFTIDGVVQMRLVKGGMESGEKSEEAVRREIEEEVGLKNAKVIKELGSYEYTVDGVCHRVISFLVETDSSETASAVSLDEGDAIIEEVIWTEMNRAIQLLTFPNEREMIRRALALSTST